MVRDLSHEAKDTRAVVVCKRPFRAGDKQRTSGIGMGRPSSDSFWPLHALKRGHVKARALVILSFNFRLNVPS